MVLLLRKTRVLALIGLCLLLIAPSSIRAELSIDADFDSGSIGANTIDGIAKAYKGKLCAMVDIDEQMLPFCSPDDIDRQIREIVEKVGSPEGGLIIYAIPSEDVPLENIEAICSGWEKYCFYNWP